MLLLVAVDVDDDVDVLYFITAKGHVCMSVSVLFFYWSHQLSLSLLHFFL